MYCYNIYRQCREVEDIDLRDVGYVTNKGTLNSVFYYNGKKYRVRVDVLILKGNSLFIRERNKLGKYGTMYRVPGGSIEPNKTIWDSAKAESREEARINIKNCKYSGISYLTDYRTKDSFGSKLSYDGSINYVMVATYDGKYSGFIRDIDYDYDMYVNGKFVPISSIRLSKMHKDAIERYKEGDI